MPMPPNDAPSSDWATWITEQIQNGIENSRTLFEADLRAIDIKLTAIDKAASLFQENLFRVPTEVDKQVGNLKELHQVEIDVIRNDVAELRIQIGKQFQEAEARNEIYASNRRAAVAATFQTQKDLMDLQHKASEAAIAKAETHTADQIKSLAEIANTTTRAMDQKFADMAKSTDQKIADLVGRMDRSDGVAKGAQDNRNEKRLDTTSSIGLLAIIFAGVSVTVGLLTYLASTRVTPATYQLQPYQAQQFVSPTPPQVSVVPVVPVPVQPR